MTAGKYERTRRDGNTEAAVAVFCAKVQDKIRNLTLSLRFVDPLPNAKLETYKTGGKHTFICECNRPHPPDVFILTQRGNLWWPQPSRIERSFSGKYTFNCWFGTTGLHIVHVVRANVLGSKLIEYYLDVAKRLEEQRGKLRRMKITEAERKDLQLWYPAISLDELPQGLFSLAEITVEVVPNSTAPAA